MKIQGNRVSGSNAPYRIKKITKCVPDGHQRIPAHSDRQTLPTCQDNPLRSEGSREAKTWILGMSANSISYSAFLSSVGSMPDGNRKNTFCVSDLKKAMAGLFQYSAKNHRVSSFLPQTASRQIKKEIPE
ncbi:hypothetical protein, partial [Thiolapillus sp.]